MINKKKNIYLMLLVSFILFLFLNINAKAKGTDWYSKGTEALNKGDYETAIDAFSNAINDKPDMIKAYYKRGTAYLYIRKIDDAAGDFTKIIQLDSTIADAFNNRGLCSSYAGHLNKAISDFEVAIELDSNFAQAYLNLGSAYFAIKMYDQAISNLDIVIKLDSKNPESYLLRASSFYAQNELKKAIKDYTKSINLGLSIQRTFQSRGNAYFKLKEFEKAIADYTKTLEFDSLNTEVINNRSIAYSLSEQKELAEKDRMKLAIISSGMYDLQDINKTVFERYSFWNGDISLELPKTWHSVDSTTIFGGVMVIAVDSVNYLDDYYISGVRMSIDTSISKIYELKSGEEIIGFWDSIAVLNREQYDAYIIIDSKDLQLGDYKGKVSELSFQVNKKSNLVRLYELVISNGKVLFYAYMQSPEVQFVYYRKIFEKAIKSLRIK